MPTLVAVFLSLISLSFPSSPSLTNTAALEVWYRNRCSEPIWHRMNWNYQLCTQKFPPVFSLDTHLFFRTVSIPLLRGFQPGIASLPFYFRDSTNLHVLQCFNSCSDRSSAVISSPCPFHHLTLILPAAPLMHLSWVTYQHTDAKGGRNYLEAQILSQTATPLS